MSRHCGVPLFLLFSFQLAYALTPTEISAFGNGATVSSFNATHYRITATGLPDHDTQKVNPNTASHQSHEVTIAKNPTFTRKTCLPLGQIGVTIKGVSLFNPLTVEGYDAVNGANKEIFDSCNGHPTNIGEYHYHQLPNCTYNGTADEFIGVALDGFSVYGPNVSEFGRNIRNSDLDECHGLTSTINGVTAYRYYINSEYPYIMGCFRGDIVPTSDMSSYNTSIVCSANATACNCPVTSRGPPPRRPNDAVMISSHIMQIYVLVALVGIFFMK